jgi:hypothetical protein
MSVDLSFIRTWFDAHPNVRLVVKYGVLGVIGGILYVAGNDVTAIPADWAPIFTSVLAILNEKYKLLTPFEPWPLIGAKTPAPAVVNVSGPDTVNVVPPVAPAGKKNPSG